MARSRLKWKCIFISYLIILNVFTKSLPVYEEKSSSFTTTGKKNILSELAEESKAINNVDIIEANNDVAPAINMTRNRLLRNDIRPGQTISQYTIQITDQGNSFRGRIVMDVEVTQATRNNPIRLHAEGLNVQSARTYVFNEENTQTATFRRRGNTLEVTPALNALSYVLILEYTGSYGTTLGHGFHKGVYENIVQEDSDDELDDDKTTTLPTVVSMKELIDEGTYLAMNLHPNHARRVFPCMDEPTEVSMIRFTYNNFDYTHLLTNSMLEDNSNNEFRALQGPPHLWGMIAHNFVTLNIPTAQVLLYGRSVSNQHDQASIAINSYFNNLNEWTNKPYFEIVLNQDGRLNIVALPDVSTEWHALSTIGIWEPHVFMETTHSISQRKTALFEIAKAMAKQWFGYVIFPENWRYEWVVSGLATYAAYEMMKVFQNDATGDVTLLDVNTIFVTDVIQESLLRDAYVNAQVLEPENDIFDDEDVRDHVHGLLKYKAPALLRMLRVILGEPDQDFIQSAARALLTGMSLQAVNSFNFVDAINSDWTSNGNGIVDDVGEFLEPWILTTGYPLLHVSRRQGGVMIMQERFSFVPVDHHSYLIPITYATSNNPDFSNIQPVLMNDASTSISFALGEDDWVIFNVQAQGYYRVNYEPDLWENILEALEDEERREEIHPLNRASLVDDALNLARAGRLDYDIAFRVVLSMELETEYAVWKAFVRNMDFLKKRLEALVEEDEDLDPDIYLRMVRRTIITLEDELGFEPDVSLTEPAMHTLTRGLVMDHACRAGYNPCIAAAVDWFYDDDVVNPNIPHEIRPAVYCTMVREGNGDVIDALYDRLEIEPTLYERVVILESLACSQDEDFVRMLLEETISQNSPYSVEERNKIFAAVARSSYTNAMIAVNFIAMRTNEIRNNYGGPDKLDELIHILAENMADSNLATEFRIWVNAQNNNLDDSQDTAERALALVNQNLDWDNAHLMEVYEWIDENDASTMALSILALCFSLIIALLNH